MATHCLESGGFTWKPSSLGFLSSDDEVPDSLHIPSNRLANGYVVPKRDELEILGTMMDSQGSAIHSWQYRTLQAETRLGSLWSLMRKPLPWKEKVKCWRLAPVAPLAFNCGGMVWTPCRMLELRRWEAAKLRRVLKLRMAPQEPFQTYFGRTNARIDQVFLFYQDCPFSSCHVELPVQLD